MGERFRDAKQSGGMEQVQGWCEWTIQRQAPLPLIVQTWAETWYLWDEVRAKNAAIHPLRSSVNG